jgi:hypothetical protein
VGVGALMQYIKPVFLIMRKTDVNEEEISEEYDRKKRAL